MVFKENYYLKTNFDNLTLSNYKVTEIEFEECNFTNCRFLDCEFVKCAFKYCMFDNCLISALMPVDTRFIEVTFKNSKVIGIDWTKSLSITRISFNNCQLNYSNFRFLKLPKTKIINSEVKEADFTEALLTESDFSGSDLEGSIFFKSDLMKSDFSSAKNYYIDARNNTINKAKFSLPEAISLLNSLDIILK